MQNVELIVRALEQAGARWVFGIPSGPVLALMEALRRSRVEFVLTATETSAGFMAATVGTLTSTPGVCVATVGPGATNLATGVGAAWLDGAPVLAFTCNVPSNWLQRRIQMRIDHQALFRPLTKASFALTRDNVAEAMAEAIGLALAETPGPVHLDLPDDVGSAPASGELRPGSRPDPLPDISNRVVGCVREALERSQRPLVVTGLAFTRSRAHQQALEFIERQNLPFISTLHAKGYLPESHPNWAGVLGRARRSDVQAFVHRADLVIALGYDEIEINYEEWVGDLPLIHISSREADIEPGVNTLLNVGGNLDAALASLAGLPASPNAWTTVEFEEQRALLERNLRPPAQGMAAYHVLDLLRERLPADGILAYDVGAHTHQIASQWRTNRPGTCLATNGWSSMGYGMPAAYAAKLVHPDRRVVGVVGDGCFQMTAGELALARRLGLAVPIVVLNDGWLGLMKVKQERKDYPLYGVRLGEVPASPAHYFGVPCREARTSDELNDALDWAFGLGGPSVVEARIDAEPYSYSVFD